MSTGRLKAEVEHADRHGGNCRLLVGPEAVRQHLHHTDREGIRLRAFGKRQGGARVNRYGNRRGTDRKEIALIGLDEFC